VVKPSTVIALSLAVLAAMAGVALAIFTFVHRTGGKEWFFWLAPLILLGFAGLMGMFVLGYYLKVGRYEMKARPRGE